jgi:hypothetical protein
MSGSIKQENEEATNFLNEKLEGKIDKVREVEADPEIGLHLLFLKEVVFDTFSMKDITLRKKLHPKDENC